jgi:hypothetical protein
MQRWDPGSVNRVVCKVIERGATDMFHLRFYEWVSDEVHRFISPRTGLL